MTIEEMRDLLIASHADSVIATSFIGAFRDQLTIRGPDQLMDQPVLFYFGSFQDSWGGVQSHLCLNPRELKLNQAQIVDLLRARGKQMGADVLRLMMFNSAWSLEMQRRIYHRWWRRLGRWVRRERPNFHSWSQKLRCAEGGP